VGEGDRGADSKHSDVGHNILLLLLLLWALVNTVMNEDDCLLECCAV
jgi:hypothetical protein